MRPVSELTWMGEEKGREGRAQYVSAVQLYSHRHDSTRLHLHDDATELKPLMYESTHPMHSRVGVQYTGAIIIIVIYHDIT